MKRTVVECVLMERLHIQPSELANLTETQIREYLTFIMVSDEIKEQEMNRLKNQV